MTRRTIASASKLVIPILGLLAGGATQAAFAQGSEQPPAPTQQDQFRAAASALLAQRSDLYRKKDAAGVASLYTPNALYIELEPTLDVMRGHDQIQRHVQQIMNASAPDFNMTVVTANATGPNTMDVAGNYGFTSTSGNKPVSGHFFQTLRREGGTWKIAEHVFARPEPVTVGEVDTFRGN